MLYKEVSVVGFVGVNKSLIKDWSVKGETLELELAETSVDIYFLSTFFFSLLCNHLASVLFPCQLGY